MSNPFCSVVVCTRHRPALLARCLGSLRRLDHPSYEMIVVDNTPGEPAVERLAEAAGARYVIEPLEGLSRARNTGARAAEGAIMAFIDDDAIAERAWLSRHSAALEDSTLAATTGRVLPASLDTAAARAYAATGGEDLGEVPLRVDRSTLGWFELANFGGVGVGGNMAFRRTLFEQGWAFRESLGLGAGIQGEEHYAFFSLVRAGHTIAYLPDAVVRHDYPATMSEARGRRFRVLQSGAAYMLMLVVEEPEFRRETLRYMWQAARGRHRQWRRGHATRRLGNRGQLAVAGLAAVPLYARTFLADGGRFRGQRLPAPPVEPERRQPSAPS